MLNEPKEHETLNRRLDILADAIKTNIEALERLEALTQILQYQIDKLIEGDHNG